MIAQVVKPFDSDEHKMKAAFKNNGPEASTEAEHDSSTMAKARFMISDILEQARPTGADFYLPVMAAMAAYRPASAAANIIDEASEDDVKEHHSEGNFFFKKH